MMKKNYLSSKGGSLILTTQQFIVGKLTASVKTSVKLPGNIIQQTI